MFGDEPSQVDCAVFGQLTQVIYHVPDSVQAKHAVKGISHKITLMSHDQSQDSKRKVTKMSADFKVLCLS